MAVGVSITNFRKYIPHENPRRFEPGYDIIHIEASAKFKRYVVMQSR